MRIAIPVTERRVGFIDIDVPEGSPILDPDASSLKKRKAAKKLGEDAIRNRNADVRWSDRTEDGTDTNEVIVDLSYFILDEENK